MQLGQLGPSGPRVSSLGLGLAALGRPGYINLGHGEDLGGDYDVDAMRTHAHRVLDAAFAAGVRYVDAARSYGRAEEFLADWLAAAPDRAASVVVGSKWGYTYTADWRVDAEQHEVKDHSVRTLRRQLGETRRHLGDQLALYQIHSATLRTGVLEDPEVLGVLRGLADEGVLVGLTLSGPRQADTLRRALEVTADGAGPFGAVQATWNLLEPSVGPVLREAHDRGWGVLVKEAVANGRLTPRGERHPALDAVAADLGVGVDAVALAAASAQPFADVVLSGAATVAQLESNVRAVELELSDEQLAALAGLAEPPEDYWATRDALPWN